YAGDAAQRKGNGTMFTPLIMPFFSDNFGRSICRCGRQTVRTTAPPVGGDKKRETETGCLPHQFRPRNNRHEHLRLCMKIIENTRFLPRLRGFLPLITVWLEVRVLPGPPRSHACADIS